MRLFALFRLAFATATPVYGLTLPRRVSRRLIKPKARGHPVGGLLRLHLAPTACKHTVSGSISLPSPGFFSPFPHGTGTLSVASSYLALGDGPPGFPRDCTCPAVLRNCFQEGLEVSSTGLSPSMVTLSRGLRLFQILITSRVNPEAALQPHFYC